MQEYTKEKICPQCQRIHTLSSFPGKLGLDGTSLISVQEIMNTVAICECGMLVTHIDILPGVTRMHGYQDKLAITDEVIRKIELLWLTTGSTDFLLYGAKYCRSIGNQSQELEYLMKAIQCFENGLQFKSHFSAKHFVYAFKKDITITEAHKLTDLYRRIGNFDKALELLAKCANDSEWYFMEQKLIQDGNNTPQ